MVIGVGERRQRKTAKQKKGKGKKGKKKKDDTDDEEEDEEDEDETDAEDEEERTMALYKKRNPPELPDVEVSRFLFYCKRPWINLVYKFDLIVLLFCWIIEPWLNVCACVRACVCVQMDHVFLDFPNT